MSLPLTSGQNINFNREIREPYYEMRIPDKYNDFYALSYIISGKRKLFTPNRINIVDAGTLFFINKNVHFRNTYLNETTYERICVKFTDKMINDLIESLGKEGFHRIFDDPIYHFNSDTQDQLMRLFVSMQNEYNNYNKYSELILKSLLNQIIIISIRERVSNTNNNIILEKEEAHIIKAVQYIDNNYYTSPSLNITAAIVYLTPTYFSKLFKKAMGCTYSEYLNNAKLDNARRLLVETNLTMNEISENCGFSNSNYFCDVFKRTENLSPTNFRKMYNQKKIKGEKN